MMTLTRLTEMLEQDMAAGAAAIQADFIARTSAVIAIFALSSYFLKWQVIAVIAIAIVVAEVAEIACVRISKAHFSLKLYGVWASLNILSAFSFCSLALFLVTHSSPTAVMMGFMVIVGCMTQPLLIGVGSIALSYGCLIVPVCIASAITMYFTKSTEHQWAGLAGLLILSLHSIMVIYKARSVMRAKNKAQHEATEAAKAKTRFMTTISHEIRTPLNGIMGIAELQRSQAKTQDSLHQANILIDTSESLKSILDDILDQAKIEAGQMQLIYAPVDLRNVVRHTVALFQANAQQKHLELRCEFRPDDEALTISMDRLRIGQILSNLVSNAIKFTDQGSVVVKTTLLPNNRGLPILEVIVADSGRGMTDDEMGQLFRDFSQVDDEHARAAMGTGLGLSISHGLVTAMGGTLKVRSTIGKGSEFVLTLPCTRIAPAASSQAVQDNKTPDLTGWRILAADDTPANRYIVEKFLNSTQAEVTIVSGGTAALEAMKVSDQDVLLLDIKMPDMDGTVVFDKMQNLPKDVLRPKVIALTANTLDDARRNYCRMGMDGFLPKPLKRADLFAELERIGLNAPKPNPAKI
ncbi:ATP-binding protein [Ascidiaceihabitans sp.]|uniref:ATP-binding protein n=1 Tax=Ascidiaceihabitans sp. TaxID=1872644 RepID=UPI003296F507